MLTILAGVFLCPLSAHVTQHNALGDEVAEMTPRHDSHPQPRAGVSTLHWYVAVLSQDLSVRFCILCAQPQWLLHG